MRQLILSMVFIALMSGCSIFGGGKRDVAGNPDLVQDASSNKDPIVNKDPKIFDGGKYSDKEEITDIKLHGGESGRILPVEKFYSVDREKFAPLNKIVYVLTNEQPSRCVVGKFTTVDNVKRLIVFTKSPVPTNYCVYQKSFSSGGQGFSIWAQDGGVCKPSSTTVVAEPQRKISSVTESVSYNVSFTYCTEDTRSFGEELSRGNVNWTAKKSKHSKVEVTD